MVKDKRCGYQDFQNLPFELVFQNIALSTYLIFFRNRSANSGDEPDADYQPPVT